MANQFVWFGEENRPLTVHRPCGCGCDTREGIHDDYAGYISGSDEHGRGFTIWIKEECVFLFLKRKFEEEKDDRL